MKAHLPKPALLEPILMGAVGFSLQFLGIIWLSSGRGLTPRQWLLVGVSLLLADALGQHAGMRIKNTATVWWGLTLLFGAGAAFGLPNLALSAPLAAWGILLAMGVLLNIPLVRLWHTHTSRVIGWITLGELSAIWGMWLLYPLVGWRWLAAGIATLCLGMWLWHMRGKKPANPPQFAFSTQNNT